MNSSADAFGAFGSVLDDAIQTRKQQRSRKATEANAMKKKVEAFSGRAKESLDGAAGAINKRLEALKFDGPAMVEVTTSGDDDGHSQAEIKIVMCDGKYDWKIAVWSGFDQNDVQGTGFEIRANRGGWFDAWGCDHPSEECNPAGLTIDTSGDEIAKRFMTWLKNRVIE